MALAFALMATPSAGLAATLDARVDVGGVPLIGFLSTALDKQAQLLEVGASLEAAVELALAWNEDPYLAFRLELTNRSSSTLPVSFLFDLAAVPFTTSTFTIALDTTLIDTSGDGQGSWLQTGNAFGIFDSATGFAFLLPPMQHDLTEFDMTSSTCCPFPGPPPLPGSTSWNTLEALGFGNLSAGDTILIEGYFCVAPTGSSCPARPVLTPEPRVGALALLSLAALSLFSRRPQPS